MGKEKEFNFEPKGNLKFNIEASKKFSEAVRKSIDDEHVHEKKLLNTANDPTSMCSLSISIFEG